KHGRFSYFNGATAEVGLVRRSAPRRPGRSESPAQAGHRWEGRSQEQRPIRPCREGVAGQVGPGGGGDGSAPVGELQDEPWEILPPEVVHHGGEDTAYGTAVLFDDTNARPADVE